MTNKARETASADDNTSVAPFIFRYALPVGLPFDEPRLAMAADTRSTKVSSETTDDA